MGRGQISMEFLMIVGFAFLLLIPIILIAFTQSSRFSGDVTSAQIEKVGSELTEGINEVFYSGPPTKRTMRIYFPQGITSVALNEHIILFTIDGSSGEYEYAVSTATNLSGAIRPFSGVHKITLTAGEQNVTIEDN